MRRLVEEAELSPADTVLEVGPGVGNLTELLVEKAGHVVAVEVDHTIAAIARERLAGATNLDFVMTDILADKHHIAPKVLKKLEARRAAGGTIKLVANLPYAAATPLVADLLLHDSPPERLVFTVQEEVALRFVAAPGTHEYGPVGVLIQALAKVEILRRLGPSVFWPPPRVWSSMVRVWPRPDRRVRIKNLAVFRKTIEGLFGHRRKRAARSLSLADAAGAPPEAWAARLKEAGLDPLARGETYTVEEIIRLANLIASE
jgi:16S rRNA (adenine1518-N6/adenine1519-N6)-dimethyltransferase